MGAYDRWELFQSTLPRGERHLRQPDCGGGRRVSIHAPTRGATPCFRLSVILNQVSIHAPTRGATKQSCFQPFQFLCFNPRSHEGSDFMFVSIEYASDSFNPRSHEGSDARSLCFPSYSMYVSIHAPTRGATTLIDILNLFEIVSIHAPTRGATYRYSDKDNL